jgi:hypothetical protein
MRKIIITSTPLGEAPLWVRNKWVGVTLSINNNSRSGLRQRGVMGGTAQNGNGYAVSLREAVAQLRLVAPEAADWWDANLPQHPGVELVFAKNVCKLARTSR